MRTPVRCLLTAGALLVAPAVLRAQDTSETVVERPPGHAALNLTVGGIGISIGNSARVNGLRINWSDRGLEAVNGVNLTLWKPDKHLSGVINGVAIGLAGLAAVDEALVGTPDAVPDPHHLPGALFCKTDLLRGGTGSSCRIPGHRLPEYPQPGTHIMKTGDSLGQPRTVKI